MTIKGCLVSFCKGVKFRVIARYWRCKMGRLPGFDYKKPFFYMVTLKRARGRPPAGARGTSPADAGLCKTGAGEMQPAGAGGCKTGAAPILPFCAISDDGRALPNAITEAFEAAIGEWAEFWRSVESVLPHVIMPDHLHLLVKLAAVEKAVSLAVLVGDLKKRLNRAYWAAARGMSPADAGLCKTSAGGCKTDAGLCKTSAGPVIDPEWHDWIVKKERQLAAFRKYILQNPPRHALRRANSRYFTRARQIVFQGRRYWAYGNEALLELPVIVAIKGHRKPLPGMPPAGAGGCKTGAGLCKTSAALMAAAARIGPGGAGLSTFLSPLEKDAGNAIVKAGGALIVLSMNGFGERWHPGEKQERLCAAGRMLYLSPYGPQRAKLDKREMHIRSHALVDWALEHSHRRLEAWP